MFIQVQHILEFPEHSPLIHSFNAKFILKENHKELDISTRIDLAT